MGVGLSSCSKDDSVDKTENKLTITKVAIPSNVSVVAEADITIMGQGFASGDKIHLASTSNPSEKYIINSLTVSNENAIFSLPPEINSGKFTITLVRGDRSLLLGSFKLSIIAETIIPDVTGMTVKGIVLSDGEGVEGVVVSDGYEVTKTNIDGIYYLPSEKKNKYVFISVPGNYEVSYSNNLPVFFKRLDGGTSVEQKDFSLTKTDNTKHVVIAMADWHLRNTNNDIAQYTNGILPDINATISSYKSKGVKVYGLTLGDLAQDSYWYSNKFALPEYLEHMNKVNCPIFNVMGNHDKDPYSTNDWDASQPFKDLIAPNYYSFNLGKVHYVVLDDTEVMNSYKYNSYISDFQLEWLKKDLAMIKDKDTPIVIGMHIQLYKYPALNADGSQRNQLHVSNGNDLITLLQDFNDVHVLSGHTHTNYTVEESPKLMEHNTAAICATWWHTGMDDFARNHICPDGSPGGYGVYEFDGKDIKWYYKSMGYEKEYQFRTYDLNTIHITAKKYAPKASNETMAKYAEIYSRPSSNNTVLINVWNYDSKWEVEVKENGVLLDVERIVAKDPLYIISFDAHKINKGESPDGITGKVPHFFRVKASNPTSTLDIKVTDRFGNIFSETMERPKELTYSMY